MLAPRRDVERGRVCVSVDDGLTLMVCTEPRLVYRFRVVAEAGRLGRVEALVEGYGEPGEESVYACGVFGDGLEGCTEAAISRTLEEVTVRSLDSRHEARLRVYGIVTPVERMGRVFRVYWPDGSVWRETVYVVDGGGEARRRSEATLPRVSHGGVVGVPIPRHGRTPPAYIQALFEHIGFRRLAIGLANGMSMAEKMVKAVELAPLLAVVRRLAAATKSLPVWGMHPHPFIAAIGDDTVKIGMVTLGDPQLYDGATVTVIRLLRYQAPTPNVDLEAALRKPVEEALTFYETL